MNKNERNTGTVEGTNRSAEKSTKRRTDQILTYFYQEKWLLLLITVTGLIYNVGMTAGPWFEGKLAGYLCDIIGGNRNSIDMLILAVWYVVVILLVQLMRFFKRLYVRKFANNVNRTMKEVLYANLIHREKRELQEESTGALMTKAISDVDACAEGMRKFTTEVFDTGVVLISYLTMLFLYDWRLTLLVMLFPPVAYIIAERMKGIVTRSAAASKESAGRLNHATLDRVSNAITYRVYGQDKNQNERYETCLTDYEKKSAFANIWETSLQPVYHIISMMGAIFILWLGGRNVLHQGWTVWDIAAFSTYLACFTKLSVKSSKAAKLFNAVQKAEVSWKRIRPYLGNPVEEPEAPEVKPGTLLLRGLSFSYPDGREILRDVSLKAEPGEIIGVTGEVASGKSTFGKVFLQEYPFRGEILFSGRPLPKAGALGYLGHQPELMSGTIEENITLGKSGDISEVLRIVCMDREISELPEGIQTKIGNEGMRLSGGQQARIALARTLYHKMPILILDDPFSAVDRNTERVILERMRAYAEDSIIILLSHRLTLFPTLHKVLWISDASVKSGTHQELMNDEPMYRRLYEMQTEGGGSVEA